MNTTADIVLHVQEAVANEVARAEAAGAPSPARGGGSATASPGRGGAAHPQGRGRAFSPEETARYDSLVHAMQRDSATYCDEPENAEDFQRWRGGFDLGARRREVEGIMRGNSFMAELHHRIVPLIVDYEAFWTRYFYRLHCLEVAEGFVPPQELEGGGRGGEDGGSTLPSPPSDGEADEIAENLKGSSLLDESEDSAAEVGLVAVASPVPSSSAHSDAEPETGADAEEHATDSTLSPVSAALSPALRARGFAPDSEVEAATASDSSTGPEWCVVKEGRRKSTAASGGYGDGEAPPPPESPPPQAADVPGVKGGDPPSTSPSDGGGAQGSGREEDDDDIDEDWGEI